MTSKLEEFAEKARQKAHQIASEGGDRLKEKLESINSEDWEQLKQVAGTLGEDAAIFVRKYPMQSVFGAAALGFLLGAAFGRNKSS